LRVLCTVFTIASLSFKPNHFIFSRFSPQAFKVFFNPAILLQPLLLLYLTGHTLASPLALLQGTSTGADSCAAAPLEQKTWTDLKIDHFLTTTAKTYKRTKENNVQSLAASFGAPNFFCGLDKACNAGQLSGRGSAPTTPCSQKGYYDQ
jgi:hypothetical protein